MYRLNELRPGERATVKDMQVPGNLRRRLLDIGLTYGTNIRCVGKSPMGDPAAYLVRGAVIALRSEDTEKITVER